MMGDQMKRRLLVLQAWPSLSWCFCPGVFCVFSPLSIPFPHFSNLISVCCVACVRCIGVIALVLSSLLPLGASKCLVLFYIQIA